MCVAHTYRGRIACMQEKRGSTPLRRPHARARTGHSTLDGIQSLTACHSTAHSLKRRVMLCLNGRCSDASATCSLLVQLADTNTR
jgi:hypothetical protein